MLSKRFAGKPLRQPSYSARDVPRCRPDLGGSLLQEVTERDDFSDCMAEMLLLCNEVMRRQAPTTATTNGRGGGGGGKGRGDQKKPSKPLSLEYIADRIDVDDPIFGYFVRTAAPPPPPPQSQDKPASDTTTALPPSRVREGMLQGFVCVTTFTNWQSTFRWDSMHDSAFAFDDGELAARMASGERKFDVGGVLSEELEGTVRCGDPWNEGVVWPRIAEISLLGGLGCGKTLLSLVIERLERLPPTGQRNYDYVALMATENSVPFYERMGFVRVGAITENSEEDEGGVVVGGGDGDGVKGGDGSTSEEGETKKAEKVHGAAGGATAPVGNAADDAVVPSGSTTSDGNDVDGATPSVSTGSGLTANATTATMDETGGERVQRKPMQTTSAPSDTGTATSAAGGDACKDATKRDEGTSGSGTAVKNAAEDDGAATLKPTTSAKGSGKAKRGNTSSSSSKGTGGAAAKKKKNGSKSTGTPPAAPPPPPKSKIISSAVDTYHTTRDGERPTEVAKRFGVDVWDVIFLNHYMYPDITPRGMLLKDTALFVPSPAAKANAVSNATRSFVRRSSKEGGAYFNSTAIQWYCTNNNDTTKSVARKFNVSVKQLVRGNKMRVRGMNHLSVFHSGTMLKVSGFDVSEDRHIPYCHWSFPDETSLNDSEPSYMMVRKLNRPRRAPQARRSGPVPDADASATPVESSLVVKVSKYVRPLASTGRRLDPSFNGDAAFQCGLTGASPDVAVAGKGTPASKGKLSKKRKSRHPDEPIPPKRPMSAYLHFMVDMREKLKDEIAGKSAAEVAKVVSLRWKELPAADRVPYEDQHKEGKRKYNELMEKYKRQMDDFMKANPEWKMASDSCTTSTPGSSKKAKKDAKPRNLFNRVVKLTSDGAKDVGSQYEYFYVLTYLPDLQWCHLAPMTKRGYYGADKPKAEGRPIWMLVDEGEELDVTANACDVVRSRAMKNVPDADEEQWDIVESGHAGKGNGNGSTAGRERKASVETNGTKSAVPLAPLFTNRAKDGLEKKEESVPPSSQLFVDRTAGIVTTETTTRGPNGVLGKKAPAEIKPKAPIKSFFAESDLTKNRSEKSDSEAVVISSAPETSPTDSAALASSQDEMPAAVECNLTAVENNTEKGLPGPRKLC